MSHSAKSKPQKSRPKHDRQEGIAYYRNLLTVAEHEGDTALANKCKNIIKCLEKKVKDEKEK